jgi:hypothetical protein
MAQDTSLIPTFIPPLAELLAHAERAKGTWLTEAEIRQIRDKGACMMLPRNEVRKLAEARGYEDVQPENCLADWSRLRVQMTGKGYLPKLILCIPGDDDFRSRSEPLLQQSGVEYEFREHDERMLRAFEVSRSQLQPSLTDADFAAIGRHTSVLYVLSENYTAQQSAAVCARILHLGHQLLDAGGIAIKCESSGVAHSSGQWRKFDENVRWNLAQPSGGAGDPWVTLFTAYVQAPIGSEDDFYSCGMHLLGQPDMIVSHALMREAMDEQPTPAHVDLALFRGFAIYVLSELHGRWFTAGHTFSLTAEAKRFRMLWEPCTGYDEDEFFFNPYGRWRFAEP